MSNNFFKNAYKKSLCIKSDVTNLEAAAIINNLTSIRTVEASFLNEDQEFCKTIDLLDFANWVEDHKLHNLNWYINNRDQAATYNYELLTFFTICKKYVRGYNIKALLTDPHFYNNVNLNYTYLVLIKSIMHILDYKSTLDFKNYAKYIYLYKLILDEAKKIARTNKKYKICKI